MFQITLKAFLPRALGETVVLMGNNSNVVAYLKKRGVTISRVMCSLAQIMAWRELHSVTLSARYIPGKTILADQLSHPNQVLLAKRFVLSQVFDAICEVFGHLHIDLFATRANEKLPLYVSPGPDPMAWEQNAFQHP